MCRGEHAHGAVVLQASRLQHRQAEEGKVDGGSEFTGDRGEDGDLHDDEQLVQSEVQRVQDGVHPICEQLHDERPAADAAI